MIDNGVANRGEQRANRKKVKFTPFGAPEITGTFPYDAPQHDHDHRQKCNDADGERNKCGV